MNTILSINASVDIQGGADRFFNELNRLMSEKGERVLTYTYKPEGAVEDSAPGCIRYYIDRNLMPEGLIQNLNGIIRVFYSPRILEGLEGIIEKEKPAIAHIHNIYHRIPYGIIDVLTRHGIKSVWWLHDYKWICPNHQLFTHGALCKRCARRRYYNSVRYLCQQESILKSVIVSAFSYFVDAHGWRDRVDRFIAPSASVLSLFREFHFPDSKIRVLPHFNYCSDHAVRDSSGDRCFKERPYALYAGRIEKNKGLFHCVQAFGATGYPLKIIGTGNFETELKNYCKFNGFTNVEFMGHRTDDELYRYYGNALFVMVPSVWHEVFGLSILESYNFGRPVVAASIGAIPEIVEDGKTGLLYRPGDFEDLGRKVRMMFENPDMALRMGICARETAARKYAADRYWGELEKMHRELL